jgi:hypothetical protein
LKRSRHAYSVFPPAFRPGRIETIEPEEEYSMSAIVTSEHSETELPPPVRGFSSICCVLCGDEGSVSARLDNLDLHCSECDQDFHRDDVRRHIENWARCLAWLDSAPIAEEG